MFRCRECQKEYKNKPDFCECGNDIFDEVTKEKQKKKSLDEYYPFIAKFKDSLDPLSLIIFILCIFLSFCALIFIKSPKNTVNDVKEEKVIKNIPDIETFWNNTPPKTILNKPKEEVQAMPKIVIQTVTKVVNPIPIKKSEKITKITLSKKAEKITKTAPRPPVKKLDKPSQVQPVKAPVKKEVNITVPLQNANTKTNPQEDQAKKEELRKYKISLRNLLFSKIDFASIVGDGICAVSFAVSNDGKLINRNFKQKSPNPMLNDAVYSAFLSTPNYKAPPAGYRGETMNFTVQFVGGKYEIDLR